MGGGVRGEFLTWWFPHAKHARFLIWDDVILWKW